MWRLSRPQSGSPEVVCTAISRILGSLGMEELPVSADWESVEVSGTAVLPSEACSLSALPFSVVTSPAELLTTSLTLAIVTIPEVVTPVTSLTSATPTGNGTTPAGFIKGRPGSGVMFCGVNMLLISSLNSVLPGGTKLCSK